MDNYKLAQCCKGSLIILMDYTTETNSIWQSIRVNIKVILKKNILYINIYV